MRIRKNAKLSDLLYTNSNLLSANASSTECILPNNNLLCQLNQSPWDIITFPSSHSSSSFHQFDDTESYYNVNFAGNGSSTDSIADFQSVASKTSGLGENSDISHRNGRERDNCDAILGFKKEVEMSGQIEDEEIKLCGKRDKNGWQCDTVVKTGNIMCDYHLSKLQNQAVWTTTKKKSGPARPGSELTAGARPQRAKKRPTSNPHEFYYYSGFGPSWGKKRGTLGSVSNVDSKASADHSDICDMEVEEGTDMAKLRPKELVCLDDDEEDEREKSGVIGKKRGRKPVKERSLKSLM